MNEAIFGGRFSRETIEKSTEGLADGECEKNCVGPNKSRVGNNR